MRATIQLEAGNGVWMRRVRKAALVGGAGTLVAAGVGAGLVARNRRARRRRIESGNPGASTARLLPEGRDLLVPTTDGAHLAVTVAGPDDGPTIVLAHCWTGSRAVWGTVARQLVLDGHRVVLYDQRGHGQSTNAHGTSPSIAQLGDDLRDVLDATDTTEAILVGHSMGGMTIQSYASEHPGHFAERARGVVLVATAAKVLPRRLPASVVERLMGEGRMEWTRRGRVGRAMVRGSLGQDAHRDHVQLTLDGFADTTGVARAGYLLAMAEMDLRDVLATIDVPATVLVGTRDTLTPPRLGRELAGGLPNAQLVVLPGAGHMLPLEAPGQVLEAVHDVRRRAGQPVGTGAS